MGGVFMANLKLHYRYDEDKVCENPDKGWYLHYYDNGIDKYFGGTDENDFLEDLPCLDHIYLRLAWSYLEPEEGVYNWKIIDKIIDPWVARGKKISFRISCQECGDPTKDDLYNRCQVSATPRWVFDAGAKYLVVKAGKIVPEGQGNVEPDYDDPIFLEKLENFHRAFAARYDGRDEVIYVDVGSYGTWGEGHTWQGSRQQWPMSTILKHFDIYNRCYKHTTIVMSDDITFDYTPEENRILADYIVEHGMSVRDDSVCVKAYSDTYGFDSLRSSMLYDRVWRDVPTVLELEHYQTTCDYGDYKGGWPHLAAVTASHATYSGFHGYARKYLSENKEMAAMTANRLGYWYFLYMVDLPDEITSDRFRISCCWENKGAARAYKQYKLTFKLQGKNGTYYSDCPQFSNCEMMPHTYTCRPYDLDFGGAPSGDYTLSFRMYDANDRTIEIGMKDEYRSADGYYTIGDITIK